MTKVLDARRVVEEVISPSAFVRLTDSQKKSVKTTEIVPPALGRKGFGGILVKYNVPIYRVR